MDKIAQVFATLAEQLGAAVPVLWQSFVRVEVVYNGLWLFLFLAFMTAGAIALKKIPMKAWWKDDPLQVIIGVGIFGLLYIGLSCLFATLISDSGAALIEPQGWAVHHAISLLIPK